jgi:hypothetical protein
MGAKSTWWTWIFAIVADVGGCAMVKVKTFTSELKIFQTIRELDELDEKVNKFFEENKVTRIVSVSDTVTHDNGATIGIVRVVAYETD